MAIKLKLDDQSRIMAGVVNSKGNSANFKGPFTDITDEALLLGIQHVLDTKKTDDSEEIIEFEKPFMRLGSGYHKYKVTITLTPVK